ncbi:MAG: hypothetical protein RDA78_09305 [Roseibium sp.]|uniref:hypothetical protein n=1 Tax=Roseibium sp. TaxID=1936156 RepID=UPI003D9C3D0B
MTKLHNAAAAAEIVSAVVISMSVSLAVIAYLNETTKQQRQFTMELALNYFSEGLHEPKKNLYRAIRSYQEEVKPAKLGSTDLATYIGKAKVPDSISEQELDSALLTVASFFNSAHRCVKSELCDENLMRELISEDATAIHCVFSQYFLDLIEEANVPQLASGLKFFKEEDCD